MNALTKYAAKRFLVARLQKTAGAFGAVGKGLKWLGVQAKSGGKGAKIGLSPRKAFPPSEYSRHSQGIRDISTRAGKKQNRIYLDPKRTLDINDDAATFPLGSKIYKEKGAPFTYSYNTAAQSNMGPSQLLKQYVRGGPGGNAFTAGLYGGRAARNATPYVAAAGGTGAGANWLMQKGPTVQSTAPQPKRRYSRSTSVQPENVKARTDEMARRMKEQHGRTN